MRFELVLVAVLAGGLVACSERSASDEVSLPVTTAPAVPSEVTAEVSTSTSRPDPAPSTPPPAVTTLVIQTTAPVPSSAPLAPMTTAAPPPQPSSTVGQLPGSTEYRVPVADVAAAAWGTTHSAYPATDIFVACGATVVSPVNGVLHEVRRVNAYEPTVDNPATRGGRSVTIIGDDGVRYYLAHFELIVEGLEAGVAVAAGQQLGTMGQTGRASACHSHFGISPPCPGKEWSVRRGVVWPFPYLDTWRVGDQASPVDEVADWLEANPTACDEAMADPNAGDS